MNIVGIATVKNELDIIEAFVRHTVACVDHLAVVDNGSTDGSLDVLKALQAEGLPLTLVEDKTLGIYQSRRMTMLMKEHALASLQADWVLALDADEFVSANLREVLTAKSFSDEMIVNVPWRNYMPNLQDDHSQLNPVLRMSHRFVDKCITVKTLVPRKLAALPGTCFNSGNHRLLHNEQECASQSQQDIYLAHFPIRGPGQYLAKVVLRILQYVVMPDRPPFESYDYRIQFASLKQDITRFANNYMNEAITNFKDRNANFSEDMVLDPMDYRGGGLRYTPVWDDTARGWNNILSYMETLAEQYGILANYSDTSRIPMLEQCYEVVGSFRAELDQMVRDLIAKETVIREQHRQLLEKEKLIQDQQQWLLEKDKLLNAPRLRQQVKNVILSMPGGGVIKKLRRRA